MELEEASAAETWEGDEVMLLPEKSALVPVLLGCSSCDKAEESRPLSEVSVGDELELGICKTFEPEPEPTKV